MRQIELFFRGEFYLHLATMFLAMTLLIELSVAVGINIPSIVLFLIPVVIGIAWEIAWKKYKDKPISLSDIIGTVVGGTLAIIILRFI